MKKTILSLLFAVLASLTVLAQNVTVRGTVVSAADSEPLIGAGVVPQGAGGKGVVTDIDGNFTITVAAGAELKITSVGYRPRTVKAQAQMFIKLEEDSKVLDEVVVVGYTTQRKVDVTGAITAVDVKELAKQNENNPIKALQGRVPGMNISADGGPSGAASVRIRGIGTLNNNDPLYIVDGVPTKGGMHELNPADIESIQILKDAASASIYGSRAANGVIIITTKRGSDLRISFDSSIAAQFYTNKMKVLNSAEYGRAMWQAYVNDGHDPNTNGLGYRYDWGYDSNGYPVLNAVRMNKYLDAAGTTPAADTDWFDQTTRTGFVQNYNFSASGSTEKMSSFFSMSYYKNLGVIRHSDFERFSGRVNTEFKPAKWLTVGEHFTLSRTDELAAPGGFLANVLQFNPSLPVYTVNGEFAGPVAGYPDRQNPVARLERNKDNRYKFWRTFGDAYVNVAPLPGLNLRSTFGLDYSQKMQRIFIYPVTEGNMANGMNGVEAKQEHWMRWMWNAVASYNVDFGKNHLDAVAGMELVKETAEWFSGVKYDFAVLNPDFMWPDAGSGKALAYGSGAGFSLVSFFAKANYSFDNRYLLGATLRHDGSSRFGVNNRFATFPSVSAGWRISNEEFMRSAAWLNDLKLRVSWGQTGNQEISNTARYFVYAPHYGVNESGGQSYGTSYDIAGTNGGYILGSGFKRNQIGNPDIRWETTTQLNGGLDWSLFNGSLFGSADVYRKHTTDILVQMVGIAAMGEGSSQWINAGEMLNHGFEFNLGYRNRTDFGLSYEVNGNIGAYRNKITALPGTVAANGTFGGNGVFSVVGRPMGSQAGYVADGIFRNQQEVDAHAVQEGAAPGRIRWRDLNGDGRITEKDQQWIFDPTPDFTYGLSVNLQYGDFDFMMFWQGAQGQQIISDLKKETDLWSGLNIGFLNKGQRLLQAWTPQNAEATIPALTRSDANNEKRVSTYFIENGSYLKLRNVQLGYNLPKKAVEKLGMQKLRLYAGAQNLLTVHSADFTGVDPENPNFGYPIAVNVTLGLNITF